MYDKNNSADHNNTEQARLIIVMGVSGSGKSSVAKQVAEQHNFLFVEADDFHSTEAKAWMASGKPLTNEMREPWIMNIHGYLTQQLNNHVSCVLSYSGLVKLHRDKFRTLHANIQFILLEGSETLIAERLSKRVDHFFDASLLRSQFEALESPQPDETDIKIVDITGSFATVLKEIENNIN